MQIVAVGPGLAKLRLDGRPALDLPLVGRAGGKLPLSGGCVFNIGYMTGLRSLIRLMCQLRNDLIAEQAQSGKSVASAN